MKRSLFSVPGYPGQASRLGIARLMEDAQLAGFPVGWMPIS